MDKNMTTNNLINELKRLPKHGFAQAPAPPTSQAPGRELEYDPGSLPPGLIAQIQAQAVADYLESVSPAILAATQGRTFQMFNPLSDVIDASKENVTQAVWSDNTGELTTYFTSSHLTTSQRRYYENVYQKNPADTGSAIQFAVAYGNKLGSGSSALGTLEDSAARAVYSQYKQLLLDKSTSRFTTVTSGSTDSIYAVNFQRNRTKQKLDPGNWQLPLLGVISRDSNATGSVVVGAVSGGITLIDDSSLTDGTLLEAETVYNVVSGSIAGGVYNSSAPHYYGTMYQDHSTIILDGNILDAKLNFLTNTGSNSEGDNHFALFHSISGSASASFSQGFKARNKESVTSTIYFVRIQNSDFNFTNNPSYVSGSYGEIAEKSFWGNPKSYITTIGLYNNNQELLAVAKLSKPLLKSKKREANIRVKLDY